MLLSFRLGLDARSLRTVRYVFGKVSETERIYRQYTRIVIQIHDPFIVFFIQFAILFVATSLYHINWFNTTSGAAQRLWDYIFELNFSLHLIVDSSRMNI